MSAKRLLRRAAKRSARPLTPVVTERIIPISGLTVEDYTQWKAQVIDASCTFDIKTFDWDAWWEKIKSQSGMPIPEYRNPRFP